MNHSPEVDDLAANGLLDDLTEFMSSPLAAEEEATVLQDPIADHGGLGYAPNGADPVLFLPGTGGYDASIC